jgi:hypothetical protein
MDHRRGDFPCPECGELYRENALRCPFCGEVNPLHDRPPRGGERSGPFWWLFVLVALGVGAFLILHGAVIEKYLLSGEVNTTILGLGCLLVLIGLGVRQWRKWVS